MITPETNRRISYRGILQASIGYHGFVDLYQNRVLPKKTRTLRLLGRKGEAKIIHTLLGYEVQAAYKRIHCPDMVTARYLKLFSELGCHSVKLPYDPTLTAELIPQFEAMIDAIAHRVAEIYPKDIQKQRFVIRNLFAIIRRQLRNT